MNKKLIEKVVSGILTLGMLASLAGCGGEQVTEGSSETTPSTQQSVASETSDAEAENPAYAEGEVTYPLKDMPSLKIWSSENSPSSHVASVEESPFHSGLSTNTGIAMEWEFPAAGADKEQAFNLMIAGKELPNIIWHNMMQDTEMYIEQGVIRDLTEYLPKYAPNYWKFLQENDYADKAMKTDSGKYYGFGFFREDPWQQVYMGPLVRKDWLDEQNLPVPETIEDWTTTIKTFNEAYGAKFAFEINNQMTPAVAGAFGAYGTFEPTVYVDASGKVQFAQAQEEWKNYMSWLNSLNEEGLIDPDVTTMNDDSLRTKAANGLVGISCSFQDAFNEASKKSGATWIGCPYPVANAGDQVLCIAGEDGICPAVATITATSSEEETIAALRFLDYAFTEEGFYYWNFGTEGETWNMVDGKPVFTEKITNNELGMYEALKLYTGEYGWGIGIQAYDMVRQWNVPGPAGSAAVDTWYLGNEDALAWVYPTAVVFTNDESRELASLKNTIDAYVEEMAVKFMSGEESLDNFASYLETLDSMQLNRMLEIYQAGYDRYLER